MTALTRRATAAAAAGVLGLSLIAGCSSDEPGTSSSADGDGGSTEAIKVWIQEDLPDRVAATKKITEAFTTKTGIAVEVVPVAEDQFNQVLTSSAAAGDLPDVIGGLSLPQVRSMSGNDLLDTDTIGEIVDKLDPKTFSENAIKLTADGDTQLAVPSESWTQLLIYRKDLFDKAGLQPPTTYDAILAAAEKLNAGGVAGFVGANAPGDAFTEQTIEHLALGNNCQLVDDAGEAKIDSPECIEAFDFYGKLIRDYSVPGAQDVDTTRATYFAGKAAMLIWSTFILDEMAGLRNDAKPNCPECADDPAFLAKNSGIVTTIAGPKNAAPAVFGEITSWVVPNDAAKESAVSFVDYMMNDGYVPWLAIAPEGKVPVRAGTADAANKFADAWAGLKVGVDSKAPLSDFYSADVTKALTTGAANLQRWAIPQGQGELLGALQGEHPIAAAVNAVTTGTPADAALKKAAEAVRDVAGG